MFSSDYCSLKTEIQQNKPGEDAIPVQEQRNNAQHDDWYTVIKAAGYVTFDSLAQFSSI